LKFVPSDHATITPQDIAPQRRLGQLRTSQDRRLLLALQSVAPSDDLKFTPDCVLDRDYRVHLEYKRGQHRTKLVNRHWIVAFHQHVSAPLADAYYEKLDLEIGGCLPLSEYLKDSLLGILVLDGRALRAFKPTDHVFHVVSFPRRSGRPQLQRANLPPTPCDRQFRDCAASRGIGTSSDCARFGAGAVPVPYKNCGKPSDILQVQTLNASVWPPPTAAPLVGTATIDAAAGKLAKLRVSQCGDAAFVTVTTKATVSQDVGAPLTTLSLTFNGSRLSVAAHPG
jgi:hypothetical protein